LYSENSLEKALVKSHAKLYDLEEVELEKCLRDLDTLKELPMKTFVPEDLPKGEKSENKKLELKVLSSHLKYAFLDEGRGKPVIINNSLSSAQEAQLLEVLRANEGAIG
jgi:hypothetical protein